MKVLVGMSGGLKSLVTAWLLKKQGMQVRGVYLDLIGNDKSQPKLEALERKLGISIQMVAAKGEFTSRLTEARELAFSSGENFDDQLFFHQSFLFPKLMELKLQHGFTQVSTGHRALVQEDQVSKIFRVFQNADGGFEDSLFLLGRNQEELASLLLPLGSIPSSMFEKLSKELEGGASAISSTWANDFLTAVEDLEINLEVYTTAGIRVGAYLSSHLPKPGQNFKALEGNDTHYRVIDFSVANGRMTVANERELEAQEVHFQDATWFSRKDLGLKPLSCSLIVPGQTASLPLRLLQYEGGRIKGFLNQPLSGAEANIFKGQTVLWVEGTEILGGGRVSGTR
jgi:tRNA U34 2-thiouridine synthase MnmA/TrmU